MPPLILAQADGLFVAMKRRGRFSMEREAAEVPARKQAAVDEAWKHMQAGLGKLGYEPLSGAYDEVRGPYPHIEASADFTPDPGPQATPDPRDRSALAAFEQAERDRRGAAYHAEQTKHLVDFLIVARFRRRAPRQFATVAPGAHTR